jgi:hypothetical protein
MLRTSAVQCCAAQHCTTAISAIFSIFKIIASGQ